MKIGRFSGLDRRLGPVQLDGVGVFQYGRPFGEHQNTIGAGNGFGNIVGDEDGCFLFAADDSGYFIGGVQPGLVVQGRKGFIQKQHIGL